MKKQIVTAIAIGITGILPAMAQEDNSLNEPITQEKVNDSSSIDANASLGEEVQDIKKDENGNLKSLKVVSSSRIPLSLGASKGLEIARQRARLRAKQVFLQWMKDNVTGVQSSGEETMFQLESADGGPNESGKSLETDKRLIESKVEGVVRGLELIGKKQDNETLTLIFGWKSKNADLARQAEAANNKSASSEDLKSSSGGNKIKSTGVKSETATSSSFDEY
jgi:hypothetical protein